MDIVTLLNSMPEEYSEKFMSLPPNERELQFTKGIMMTVFEEAINNKGTSDEVCYMVQNDPDFQDLKYETNKEVILEAALRKISKFEDVGSLKQFADYLGILDETEKYNVMSANNPAALGL